MTDKCLTTESGQTNDVTPRHSFEDHVGEVRLRVEAPTLAGIFEEAARALAELMLEKALPCGDDPPQRVTLRARDAEGLLVAWLNEIIFLSEIHQRIYNDVHVQRVSDTDLEAEIRGVFPEALRTAVKAATMHEVAIARTPEGYTATVVLDV